MDSDIIDEMNAAWKRELPDLDPSPLEVVGRVIVIAQYLERSVNAALEPFGLSLGQFDILATLRRQGPQGKMTPTSLMKSVMLSSGGMTNRIDRLEAAGLIRREEDPEDRRGVVVGLTKKGREVIEKAAAARFAEAKAAAKKLNQADAREMSRILREWLSLISAK